MYSDETDLLGHCSLLAVLEGDETPMNYFKKSACTFNAIGYTNGDEEETNMIIVNYFYKKANGEWGAGENTFNDCVKAVRFIYAMKRKGARCIDYTCYYPEDYAYMAARV